MATYPYIFFALASLTKGFLNNRTHPLGLSFGVAAKGAQSVFESVMVQDTANTSIAWECGGDG